MRGVFLTIKVYRAYPGPPGSRRDYVPARPMRNPVFGRLP